MSSGDISEPDPTESGESVEPENSADRTCDQVLSSCGETCSSSIQRLVHSIIHLAYFV